MKDNKDNLDETKIFKPINNESSDEVEIPRFTGLEETKIHKVVEENIEDDIDTDNIDSEHNNLLVDNGKKNLEAAEAELNQLLEQQNTNKINYENNDGNNDGDGDDSQMAKKKKKRFSRLEKFNITLIVLTTLMFIGFTVAITLWITLNDNRQDLDVDALSNKKSSILYDINGEPFFDSALYSEDGTAHTDIPYMEMDQNVVDAFISVEDSRFFTHIGFDVPRFTQAIFENLKTMDFDQGGSTITMQLIKTSHLSAEKNVKRKVQEISLSLELDKMISKDEIFEYYVNKINYGAGNSRGIENAAMFYFNKSATELNISEAALLAGVVNAPNAYSPLKDLTIATKRRNTVINLMYTHGYIDEQEAILAKSIKIENQITNESSKSVSMDANPYIDYVSVVIDEIKETMGIDIITTPLNVYTYMDPAVQEKIADIQNGVGYNYPDEIMQSGIVIGDNDTGEVIGVGAGRDSQFVKGFNRASDMYQQPGSVTKPLLSYALAFEHLGWATSHVVEDKPVIYAGTQHVLGNANGRYQGEMTLKNAVANSINTSAYLTLLQVEQSIGRTAVAQYLKESLGFSKVTTDQYNTQYSIGGSTFQISPMELFGAQAVMMNGGYYTKPHTVNYIETAENEKIEDQFNYAKTKVISEETAFLVSQLEAYNVTAGIINRMEVLGGRPYPVYAKTGTTDYGSDGVPYGIPVGAGKDQWMFASSRKYTSVVWMGWDKPEAGKQTYWTAAKYNANPLGWMNVQLLNTVHKGKANPGSVVKPAGVSEIKHILGTFPYANPIEGIESEYITNGFINSKFKNLVDLNADGVSIEKLDGFKSDITQDKYNKTVNIEWSEYPEGGAIKPKTYDISVGSVKATGTRLFDISWIFGPIEYEAEIYVDGKIVETVTSKEPKATASLEIPNGAEVKVCGYYKNSKNRGAETCVNVTNPDVDQAVVIPEFKTTTEVDQFIKENKLDTGKWKFVELDTTDKTKDKTIEVIYKAVGGPVTGQSYLESSLLKMDFEVRIYNYKPETTPPKPNPNPKPGDGTEEETDKPNPNPKPGEGNEGETNKPDKPDKPDKPGQDD